MTISSVYPLAATKAIEIKNMRMKTDIEQFDTDTGTEYMRVESHRRGTEESRIHGRSAGAMVRMRRLQ